VCLLLVSEDAVRGQRHRWAPHGFRRPPTPSWFMRHRVICIRM